MDKRIDFTGGNPDLRLDQITIDPEAHRLAIHALLNAFTVGTNPNFIISGCVVTVGGVAPSNTWSMTAGYIYLNDEVVQVESQSGTFDSGTEYLAFSKSVTYDTKGNVTYLDGTPRQTWQKNRGVITVQGSVSVTELDAINGDTIDEKIRTYIGNATESILGFARIADQTTARTGSNNTEIITALRMLDALRNGSNYLASTTNKGVVEKGTTAEILAGTVDKYVDGELLQSHESWQTPSYAANHSDYTTGDYDALRYRKLTNGMVQLRGSFARIGATSATVFTLPAGYRPSQTLPIMCFQIGTSNSLSIGEINSSGVVTVYYHTAYENISMNVIIPLD